jgi:hypothetical protein
MCLGPIILKTVGDPVTLNSLKFVGVQVYITRQDEYIHQIRFLKKLQLVISPGYAAVHTPRLILRCLAGR